jgi:septal ring factor EnvC (AmiA/AmiB activator)
MLKLNNFLLFFFGCLLSFSSFSQTKDELKKQKTELEKEISYTAELLSKTKKNKTKSLNYLKVLKSQIKSKEQLLITLHVEIALINKQIQKTEVSIIDTEEYILKSEENLQNLKDEYAKMIYAAFKQKGSRNDLIFIISSDDFNQAYKRIIYLKQYTKFRENQSHKIIESQQELTVKKEKLVQQKDRLIEESAIKGYLVTSKKDELESVNATKDEKEHLVIKLSKSERLFKKKIQDKQKKSKALDDKLRKIIEEEIRKSREEAKRNDGVNSFGLTPEALALSSEFNNNKGKLPWPLEKGVIVAQYGKQKHAVFSGIETFNNGIDIATDENSVVRVVFDGSISRIFFIKGEGKAILVNHGEYFTVYSGLEEVVVKVGDKVLSKEKLGIVLTQEVENKTELHFEIWKGYDKNDPSKWLYKAY